MSAKELSDIMIRNLNRRKGKNITLRRSDFIMDFPVAKLSYPKKLSELLKEK